MMSPITIQQSPEWFVCSKPPGWLTIPGRGSSAPVLVSWAEGQVSQKLWVVHRIDLETSGVVLFAKNEDSHRKANLWFENRQVKKAYDFLAQGLPITPIFKSNERIEDKPSSTQFEVKEKFENCFLGRAIPLTGRRHQIRIHLSKKGYPILGDRSYGGAETVMAHGDKLGVARVALHSRRLELPSGELFEAPWPTDFESWVKCLRQKP